MFVNRVIAGLKKHFYVSCLGLLICLAGEFLRKAAILTAGRNFHHLVSGNVIAKQVFS